MNMLINEVTITISSVRVDVKNNENYKGHRNLENNDNNNRD